MDWPAIFAAIISVVGDLVEKWLKDWLDNRLKAVEAKLPPADTPDYSSRVALEAVYDSLWFFQPGKKRFVASLLVPVPAAVAGKPLPEAAKAEIRATGAAA